MNRTKGMAAAIILIIFSGIGITAYTKNITSRQEENLASQVSQAQAVPFSQETASEQNGPGIAPNERYDEETGEPAADEAVLASEPAEGPAAEGPAAAGADVIEGVPKNPDGKTGMVSGDFPLTDEDLLSDPDSNSPASAMAETSSGLNPETTGIDVVLPETIHMAASETRSSAAGQEETAAASGNGNEKGRSSLESRNSSESRSSLADQSAEGQSYEERLMELDAQAEKIRSESDGSNQYVIQNAAEREWKLWDGELNRIYGIILNSLSREEAERLVKEEREWIISRDQEASKALAGSGGSMESVEYRLALALATRSRVYTLGQQYGQFLTEY